MSMPDHPPAAMPRSLAIMMATGAGLGFLRPAPGTWASIGAGTGVFLICLVVPPAWLQPSFLALAAAASLVGLATCPAAIRHFRRADPPQVVIDEVAGTWLACALVPGAVLGGSPLLATIVIVGAFRVFDIAKPWPVGWLERLPGAWGIMADDLAAGLLAGVMSAAILH
jgi:phosphatidylglycerophosphatase A